MIIENLQPDHPKYAKGMRVSVIMASEKQYLTQAAASELADRLRRTADPCDHTRPLKDPKPGIHSITDAVKADLDQRRKDGIAKYGTELKSHNGRDSLIDLYQELLDASLYVKQFLVESDN